jgi:aminopeptidase YwaD
MSMLCLTVLLICFQQPKPTPAAGEGGAQSITANEIRAHVEYLAADELEGRRAGTPGGHKAAKYIAAQFESFGLTAIDATEDFRQPFEVSGQKTENVIGFLEGSDPELKSELIVIGAHYDHLGKNEETGAIYNGADDDASGTSVMLEVAEAFGRSKERPRRSLLFIAFGAEELGLIGSRHYVDKPLRPIAKTRWMVNLEMMGRGDEGKVTVMMFGELPGPLQDSVGEHAWNEELEVVDGGTAHLGAGDQFPFHDAGIPILCFYGGDNHPDYHQPTDTAEKIQPGWMQAVARAVHGSVATLANPDL